MLCCFLMDPKGKPLKGTLERPVVSPVLSERGAVSGCLYQTAENSLCDTLSTVVGPPSLALGVTLYALGGFEG